MNRECRQVTEKQGKPLPKRMAQAARIHSKAPVDTDGPATRCHTAVIQA
jgi:hypothetical protein